MINKYICVKFVDLIKLLDRNYCFALCLLLSSSLRVPLLLSVAPARNLPISLPCYIFVLEDYQRAIQQFLNQYVYQTVV